MPKASSTPTEETGAVKKRAPRKRASTTAVPEATPRPRTRRPRKVVESEPEPVSAAEPVVSEIKSRRAPTPLEEQRQTRRKASRSLTIGLIAGVLLIGAGVGIGVSDGGQIDVVAVVNERNEKIQRGEVREGESTMTIPVQNTDVRPNGGLVPAEEQTPPPPEATASSTPAEATASSTEASISASSTEPSADTPTEPTATST